MSWIDQEDYRVGQLITHVAAEPIASLEVLRGNLDFLHTKNMASYLHDGTGSDWTTTSTVLTDLDATKFKLTLTSTGGPIMTWFQGAVRRASGSAYYMFFTIVREGDPIDAIEPNYPMYGNNWKNISLLRPYWNLPAGDHVFTVRWQISGGTVAASLKADAKPFFVVIEGI